MCNLWKRASFTRVKYLLAIKMAEFILVFDVPRELDVERKRINLELKRINAEMIQFSVWRSKNLKELISIASFIKKIGGKAFILKEIFIFE